MRSELPVPEEGSVKLQSTSLQQSVKADENVCAQSSSEKDEVTIIGPNPDPGKVQSIENSIICEDILDGRTKI